jgi:hypothetical protein
MAPDRTGAPVSQILTLPRGLKGDGQGKVGRAFLGSAVGQFLEQSIPIGNVPRLPALQSPEKHFSAGRIVAASLQRSDHLALMGDVPFPAMEKAFGLLKKLFQCGAVNGDSVAARSTPRPFFCPWSRFRL